MQFSGLECEPEFLRDGGDGDGVAMALPSWQGPWVIIRSFHACGSVTPDFNFLLYFHTWLALCSASLLHAI